MNKFKIGDQVRVIKYGHPFWENKKADDEPLNFPIIYEDGDLVVKDMYPEIVGKEGVVYQITLTQGKWKYGVTGIRGKSAWYDEQQLEKL